MQRGFHHGLLGPAQRLNATVRNHHTTIRVRYAETDAMQVAYYAGYFVWFEVARCELLRAHGHAYRDLEAIGIMLPVIEAHCDYRRPARYDDALTIETRGALLSPARVRFDYELRLAGDTAVHAVGHTVHAAINRDGRPVRLPSDLREVFA